jgi:NTE family protein
VAKKVAIACQGGGMHAAFEVGVLTEILKNIDEQKKRQDIDDKKRFELVGISGTSAGALCALMVWYGLAPKNNRPLCLMTSGISSLPARASSLC